MSRSTAPRRQCDKCPWKVTTDPHDIPNGYSVELHAALKSTIADGPALPVPGAPLRQMACHEAHSLPCVGWLHHQLTVGNNVPLRLAALDGRVDARYRLVGKQHARFEDTLPKQLRRSR